MKAQKFSDLPVAIICGGKGTRLGELTTNTPKSLVDVNGRPFIHWQLEMLSGRGFKNFVLCVGHLWSQLIPVASSWNIKISIENEPLGTAGAVRKALPSLGEEFFTIYGDSYLECDPGVLFERHRKEGLLGCVSTWQFSYYGLNIFKREAFNGAEPDLKNLCDHLDAHGMISTYEMPKRFMEIGSHEGLEEVRNHLK